MIRVGGPGLVGSAGIEAIKAHFHPRFETLDAMQAAADDDRHSLDLTFGTIIGLGGITLTCTVSYLAVPPERFSEAAQRLAEQAFCLIYQNVDDRNHHMDRARSALSHERPEDFSLQAIFGAMPDTVLGNTFDLQAAAFAPVKRNTDAPHNTRVAERAVPAAARFSEPHHFDLQGQNPPIDHDYGQARVARAQVWPILRNIAMYRTDPRHGHAGGALASRDGRDGLCSQGARTPA